MERPNRHQVSLSAILVREDGSSTPTLIQNLSLGGCCVAGENRIGEKVELVADRLGSLGADVRWATFGRSGLRFTSGGDGTPPARPLRTDKTGAAAIEYALLASMVAVAIVGSLMMTGNNLSNTMKKVEQPDRITVETRS